MNIAFHVCADDGGDEEDTRALDLDTNQDGYSSLCGNQPGPGPAPM